MELPVETLVRIAHRQTRDVEHLQHLEQRYKPELDRIQQLYTEAVDPVRHRIDRRRRLLESWHRHTWTENDPKTVDLVHMTVTVREYTTSKVDTGDETATRTAARIAEDHPALIAHTPKLDVKRIKQLVDDPTSRYTLNDNNEVVYVTEDGERDQLGVWLNPTGNTYTAKVKP